MSYVDLPVYGTPMRLAWRKHRFCCVEKSCEVKSFVLQDHRIAAKHCMLTTRAAKWATVQVGGVRTVKEVAAELDCDWHTVNDAVTTYGKALLEADRKASLDKQPQAWKERIAFGALDMSATYAAVFSVILPRAAQVVDAFHVISLANRCLDAVRRRVQTEELGHRGRRDDPLYRARRMLLVGEKKLGEEASERLSSLLELGDPNAEVAIAHRVKERLRDFYRESAPEQARRMLAELRDHCRKREMPPEIQRLGRTLQQWFDKIDNYHLARISNGPTEALNNLVKRIKRIGFCFRNFENYRIRALLHAGKPNWRVLGSIVVR